MRKFHSSVTTGPAIRILLQKRSYLKTARCWKGNATIREKQGREKKINFCLSHHAFTYSPLQLKETFVACAFSQSHLRNLLHPGASEELLTRWLLGKRRCSEPQRTHQKPAALLLLARLVWQYLNKKSRFSTGKFTLQFNGKCYSLPWALGCRFFAVSCRVFEGEVG